jgi:hypothetical protein
VLAAIVALGEVAAVSLVALSSCAGPRGWLGGMEI